MGDKVSFFDSLIVTLFSMVVVFIVLIIIAYLINLLKVISNRDSGKKSQEVLPKNEEIKIQNQSAPLVDSISEELVVVIAAAVAAAMGLNIPEVNIKTIRRMPKNTNAWSDMGIKEQLLDN